MHLTCGVKQGCPLSLLLSSLYINGIDDIAEGVSGAITGTAGVHVSHMLYADDLTLLTNEPRDMQIMVKTFLFLMLAVPPFITKILLGIWAWFSTGP